MEEIDGYYVLCDGEVQVGAGLLQMKLGSLLPPAKRCLPQIGTLRPPNRSLLCCVTNKCDSHQFSAERGEGALATHDTETSSAEGGNEYSRFTFDVLNKYGVKDACWFVQRRAQRKQATMH
jgi:hypothetical protein